MAAARKVSDFDMGGIIARLDGIVNRFDEYRREQREHMDRIFQRFERLPEQYVVRREFEDLKRDVDGIGVVAHRADEKARDAISDNKVTNAGIAPWRTVLYMLVSAGIGSGVTHLFGA